MNSYLPKRAIVRAVQWHRNGDHPGDDVWRPFEDTGQVPKEPREGKVVRYFRHPRISGYSNCPICARLMHDHGFLDHGDSGVMVCPGNWITHFPSGTVRVWSDVAFRGGFQPVGEVSDGYHTFNELYDHRHALFLALLSVHAGVLPTWMSRRHEDGSAFEGWFIAGIELPTGMISYHLPDRLWDACKALKADVLTEPNVEVRRELIRKIGIAQMLSVLKHSVLDTRGEYALLDVHLSDEIPHARFLKMLNPSVPNTWHVEGVAPECRSVVEAINWRADSQNWSPEIVT